MSKKELTIDINLTGCTWELNKVEPRSIGKQTIQISGQKIMPTASAPDVHVTTDIKGGPFSLLFDIPMDVSLSSVQSITNDMGYSSLTFLRQDDKPISGIVGRR